MIWGEAVEECSDFKSVLVVFHKNKSTFTFYGTNIFKWENCGFPPLYSNS